MKRPAFNIGVAIAVGISLLVATIIVSIHPIWEKRRFIADVGRDLLGVTSFEYQEIEYSTVPEKDPDIGNYRIEWTIRVNDENYAKFKSKFGNSNQVYYVNPMSGNRVFVSSTPVYHR